MGHAIDKHVSIELQRFHEPLHVTTMSGQQTAHVIIESNNIGYMAQVGFQGFNKLLAIHIDS